MATWVIGVIVAYLRSTSKYTVNLNSCSTIVRGRVAGFLRPSSTYTINTKIINFTFIGERVDGFLRLRSNSTIITTMINSTICKMKVGWYQETCIHVFHQPQKNQDIHHNKYHHRYDVEKKDWWFHETDILDFRHHWLWNQFLRWSGWSCSLGVSMSLENELHWNLGLNCVRFQGSMVSGTGLCPGSGSQWY